METTFNTFSEIKHTPLRVYNRVVMMNNIIEDFGKDTLEEYISNFSQMERKQMFVMAHFLKHHGPKVTQEVVTKGLDFKVDEVSENEQAE